MKCIHCGKQLNTARKYCDASCREIYDLRNNAIARLLDEESKAHGQGYSTDVLLQWIKIQIQNVQEGKQDAQLLNMKRSKKQ